MGRFFERLFPGFFLLESETRVLKDTGLEASEIEFTEPEAIILQALDYQKALKVAEVGSLVDCKNVLPLLNGLLRKGAIRLEEKLQDGYRPKKARFLRIHPQYETEEALEELLGTLSRAPKQTEVLLHLFSASAGIAQTCSRSGFGETGRYDPFSHTGLAGTKRCFRSIPWSRTALSFRESPANPLPL